MSPQAQVEVSLFCSLNQQAFAVSDLRGPFNSSLHTDTATILVSDNDVFAIQVTAPEDFTWHASNALLVEVELGQTGRFYQFPLI